MADPVGSYSAPPGLLAVIRGTGGRRRKGFGIGRGMGEKGKT